MRITKRCSGLDKHTKQINAPFSQLAMSRLVISTKALQIDVYRKAAVLHGATDDEILEVIHIASLLCWTSAGGQRRSRDGDLSFYDSELEDAGNNGDNCSRGDHDTMAWDNGKAGPAILLIHTLRMDHRPAARPVDHGGQWFHQFNDNALYNYAVAKGYSTLPQSPELAYMHTTVLGLQA